MKMDNIETIIHCEPYTWYPGHTHDSHVKPVMVTSELYKDLKKRPKIYRNRSQDANGYRFGPHFPLSSYEKISEHTNRGAQTGIIDPTIFKGDETRVIGDIYEKHADWDWENRKALKKVQKIHPGVLFIGETAGGDGAASLYGHKNKEGVVDSVILDNKYFFPDKDEGDRRVPTRRRYSRVRSKRYARSKSKRKSRSRRRYR